MVEIDSLFQTKTAKKDTLWHGTYLKSLNKGLPPPPPRAKKEIMSLAAYAGETKTRQGVYSLTLTL